MTQTPASTRGDRPAPVDSASARSAEGPPAAASAAIPPSRGRRVSTGRGWQRASGLLLALYLAGVAWATFGPAPYEEMDAAARRADAAGRAVLGGAADDSSRAPEGAVAAPAPREPSFGGLTSEEAANVVMFVPFGVLVPGRLRRRWWAAAPAGAGLSCFIEGVQLTVLDHRSPSWGDVRLNTLGVLAGLAVWVALVALRALARRPADIG